MGIIKIDLVTNTQEALAFERAGVTIIGINLGLDPRYPERGLVSSQVGEEISRSLTTARLCAILDPKIQDPYAAIAAALPLNPHYLQVSRFSEAQGGYWQDSLDETGLPTIFDDFYVSHEDEPETPNLDLDAALTWGASLIQLDLLNGFPNPWRFLQDEAYKVPDELIQVHEIAELTEKYPVLITMEVTREEVSAFRSTFPAAAGLFFRLPPGDITPTLDLITALQRSPIGER